MTLKFSNFASAAALMAVGATGALADPTVVQQGTTAAPITNSGNVTNNGGITVGTGGISGIAGSATVNATGAAASVSVSGINQTLDSPEGGFGAVSQSTNNEGTISNTPSSFLTVSGGLATGASASISATGALSAFSATGINAPTFADFNVGPITQGAANNKDVTNGGSNVAIYGITELGTAASVSISVAGALSSVSFAQINGPQTAGISTGAINQTSESLGGTVSNVGGYIELTNGGPGLSGVASSASISAVGAGASVSSANINGSTVFQPTIASITQNVTNSSKVANNAADGITLDAPISGTASSVSINASGASASVSSSTINGTTVVQPTITGGITQTVSNTSEVNNTGFISLGGGLTGIASSASISATGASASISSSSINGGTISRPTTIASITQNVSNTAAVNNNGGNSPSLILHGPISGNAASASATAVGAGAYVSFLSVK